MKVTELISELIRVHEEHGDIDVAISVDQKLSTTGLMDVKEPAIFTQVIPNKKLVSIQNFPY